MARIITLLLTISRGYFKTVGIKNLLAPFIYSEIEDTPNGLITIEATSGMLSVASDQISADTPEKRWYLYYQVTASDGELETTANVLPNAFP